MRSDPKMQEYVLDITDEPNIFSFCPCQGESVVTGMTYVQDRSPGPLVGVISLNGQDHANKWVEANPNFLERFGPKK